MSRKDRYIPDFREVVLWAVALFEEALTLANPARRRVQVRDAAIIGIVASRAPRLRALTGMCLDRHLVRSGDGWTLSFDEFLMKGETALELPNDPRINAILDRYVAVERQELLKGRMETYLWVAEHSGPLTYKAIQYVFRVRTKAKFGISFGPHCLRHSLTTIPAMVDGTNPLGPSRVLGHSAQTSIRHYNRATALEASRRHDARVSEAEDAALRLLGPQLGGVVDEEAVPSLHDLNRTRELVSSPQLDMFGSPALMRGKALTPVRIRNRRRTGRTKASN